MKKRVLLLVRGLATVLFFGLFYAFIGTRFGFFIPCIFRSMTGLKCPGCGVTHMCIDLMRLNFREAFYDNQALFVMLPIAFIIFVKKMIVYIRTGEKGLNRFENTVGVIFIIVLIVFGIVRNVAELYF